MPAQPLIKHVILKVAERCNLNCSYCYMYQHRDQSYLRRPRFMSEEVYTRTLMMLRAYCENHAPHEIGLSFHGGEPTLMGAARFDQWAARAQNVMGRCLKGIALQTNGTLLDEEWIAVVRHRGASVGLSLDGNAEAHDEYRVDFQGRGSHARALAGLRLLLRHGIPHTVLCVINPHFDGADIYRCFRRIGVESLDLMFPDVSHDSIGTVRPVAGTTPIADFLIPVFDAWMAENNSNVKIRLLWGVVSKLMGGDLLTDAFGNPKLSYLVVESDGEIEGNDVLKVCADGMAVTGLNVLRDSFDDLLESRSTVAHMVRDGIPLCKTCRACPEVDICAGGYLPHRYSQARGFDNPSVWCDDIRKLFAHIRRYVRAETRRSHALQPLAV